MAYEGDPRMSPKHFDRIGNYIINYAVDDEKLKEHSRESILDFCNQAIDECLNVHEMLLNVEGPKKLIENYSFLIGLIGETPEDMNMEVRVAGLGRIYNELFGIAGVYGGANITSSQKVLLEKTAEVWGLSKATDDSVEFTPEQIERLYAGKNPFGDDYQEEEI
jgi:hypothetical protein